MIWKSYLLMRINFRFKNLRFKYLDFKLDDEMGVMHLQLVAKRIRYSRHPSIHSQGFQALSCECVDGMASKSMMMCLDHVQKWLDFGQAVSFFLHLTQFLFSEMSLWVYAEFTTGILKMTEKKCLQLWHDDVSGLKTPLCFQGKIGKASGWGERSHNIH